MLDVSRVTHTAGWIEIIIIIIMFMFIQSRFPGLRHTNAVRSLFQSVPLQPNCIRVDQWNKYLWKPQLGMGTVKYFRVGSKGQYVSTIHIKRKSSVFW